MMGKKNLEQLFKDTFRDFQEAPDEKVWASIENSLDNKKQRKRIIPIWWQLGGIAAALAILFYFVNPFDAGQGNDRIVSDTENTVTPNSVDENVDERDSETPSAIVAEEGLVESSKETDKGGNISDRMGANSPVEDQVAQTNDNHPSKEVTAVITGPEEEQEIIAMTNPSKETEKLPKENPSGEKETQVDSPKGSNAIANNMAEKEKSLSEGASQEKEVVALNEEEVLPSEKKSIFDAIKEQEEEEIVAQNTSGKWSMGPSVAPVYYGASGDGSPIHSDFSANSKSGNLNLSYGLTVGYELGKKLKIRSGVHRVNYGYDTNDVVFSSSLRSSTSDKFANINYSQNSETLVVQSKKSGASLSDVSSKEVALSASPALDGKMVQQLGYIEVPLELNYSLLDKKFGVDLIGGVSSLFLVDNAVLLESDGLITEIGEANNVNNLNFSANVGMGLNYQFAPKFQLNIEPVFKYQLNTFSNTAGSFRPFSVGVYSGVSFKF